MNFEHLVGKIHSKHDYLQKAALRQTNYFLTIRNWLIVRYLFEYEQKGDDRAKYGEKLYRRIADELKRKNIKGLFFHRIACVQAVLSNISTHYLVTHRTISVC